MSNSSNQLIEDQLKLLTYILYKLHHKLTNWEKLDSSKYPKYKAYCINSNCEHIYVFCFSDFSSTLWEYDRVSLNSKLICYIDPENFNRLIFSHLNIFSSDNIDFSKLEDNDCLTE